VIPRYLVNFDLDDLPGEVGRDEYIAAARAGVVEPAGPDDVHAVALVVLIAHKVLGDFADGVR